MPIVPFARWTFVLVEEVKADVDRHLKTAKHINMLQQMETQPSLSTFMADSRSRNVENQAT